MINIKIITTDTVALIIPTWFVISIIVYMICDVIIDIILMVKKHQLKKK